MGTTYSSPAVPGPVARRVLLAALLVAGRVAVAQTPDLEADHRRGVELRAQHRDADALEVFRGLWARTQEPRALARMGLAEAALGRWADAEEHLGAALARADDGWIAQNRAALAQGLAWAQEHLGSLRVVCPTPGAEVWIGGARAAVLPLDRPLRVTAGAVAFEVRAPGGVVAARTVQVPPGNGSEVTEEVALSAGPSPAVAVRVAPSPRVEPPRVEPPRVEPPHRVAAGVWAAALGGGAALATGTVFTVLTASDSGTYGQAPTPDLRDRGRLEALVADVAFGVALVGAVVAVVWYLLDRPRGVESGAQSGPRVGVAPAGVAVRF